VPDDLGSNRVRERRERSGDAPRDLTSLYEGESPPRREVRRVEPDEAKERQEDEAKPPENAEQQAERRRKRLIIAAAIGAVLLVAAIGLGWYWYTTWRWLQSTDDAYTQADNTVVSPKISGYVSELLVTDNQAVKAGDVLVHIDPRDYRAALDQAQADVASAEADIRSLDAQIALQQSTIDQARADVASAEANLTFSQQEYGRYEQLAKTLAGTLQRAQQAAADLRDKTATVKHNQATLAAAEKQIAVLQAQRAKAQATLQHNRAALEQARLNLGYAVISSPIDGAVGDRSVRLGQYVQPGTQLMSIVPMKSGIYVVANFKETQIRRMFRGESVDLTVDTFPAFICTAQSTASPRAAAHNSHCCRRKTPPAIS
jgi:membrane fusion protein (multidrug efflux system)